MVVFLCGGCGINVKKKEQQKVENTGNLSSSELTTSGDITKID